MIEIQKENHHSSSAVKFVAKDGDKPIGRAYLYILHNDLHPEPFGFLEDVFVEEAFRSRGIGRQLVEAVIAEAKNQDCYKLICTARISKPEVHTFYEKFGFRKWGSEFRMDFHR